MTHQADDNLVTAESKHAWMISLVFWLTLLSAIALYAAVALSPRFFTNLKLKSEHHANQVRLVTLENQVNYLNKVVDALENEPAFAEELARVDFDAARPDDERIPVDPDLALDARIPEASASIPVVTLPWYSPILRMLAENQTFRTATLSIAALLVIVAFTFLHESQANQLQSATSSAGSFFQAITNRYRKFDNEM